MADGTEHDTAIKDANKPTLPADVMIILAVRQTVLFPGITLPLAIGRPSSIAAAQEAVRTEGCLESSCKPIRRLTIRPPTSSTGWERLHKFSAM